MKDNISNDMRLISERKLSDREMGTEDKAQYRKVKEEEIANDFKGKPDTVVFSQKSVKVKTDARKIAKIVR